MGNVCFANMYGWYHKMKKVRPFVLFVNHMCKSQRKTGKPLLQRGALLYAMYGEGELGADCYCAASDYEQAQNAAEPIAQAIENSEPLADLHKFIKVLTVQSVVRCIVITLMELHIKINSKY